MYDYITPPGFGDTFYQYVFDASLDGPLTDGIDYRNLGVKVVDGDFILRYWSGLSTRSYGRENCFYQQKSK